MMNSIFKILLPPLDYYVLGQVGMGRLHKSGENQCTRYLVILFFFILFYFYFSLFYILFLTFRLRSIIILILTIISFFSLLVWSFFFISLYWL